MHIVDYGTPSPDPQEQVFDAIKAGIKARQALEKGIDGPGAWVTFCAGEPPQRRRGLQAEGDGVLREGLHVLQAVNLPEVVVAVRPLAGLDLDLLSCLPQPSWESVAERLGVSLRLVQDSIERLGIAHRKPTRRQRVQVTFTRATLAAWLVCELAAGPASVRCLADKAQVSDHRVRSVLKELATEGIVVYEKGYWRVGLPPYPSLSERSLLCLEAMPQGTLSQLVQQIEAAGQRRLNSWLTEQDGLVFTAIKRAMSELRTLNFEFEDAKQVAYIHLEQMTKRFASERRPDTTWAHAALMLMIRAIRRTARQYQGQSDQLAKVSATLSALRSQGHVIRSADEAYALGLSSKTSSTLVQEALTSQSVVALDDEAMSQIHSERPDLLLDLALDELPMAWWDLTHRLASKVGQATMWTVAIWMVQRQELSVVELHQHLNSIFWSPDTTYARNSRAQFAARFKLLYEAHAMQWHFEGEKIPLAVADQRMQAVLQHGTFAPPPGRSAEDVEQLIRQVVMDYLPPGFDPINQQLEIALSHYRFAVRHGLWSRSPSARARIAPSYREFFSRGDFRRVKLFERALTYLGPGLEMVLLG